MRTWTSRLSPTPSSSPSYGCARSSRQSGIAGYSRRAAQARTPPLSGDGGGKGGGVGRGHGQRCASASHRAGADRRHARERDVHRRQKVIGRQLDHRAERVGYLAGGGTRLVRLVRGEDVRGGAGPDLLGALAEGGPLGAVRQELVVRLHALPRRASAPQRRRGAWGFRECNPGNGSLGWSNEVTN